MLDFYTNLAFYPLALAALIVYRLLSPHLEPGWRSGLLALLSLPFLALLEGGRTIAPLMLLCSAVLYAAICRIRAGGAVWPWVVFFVGLVTLGKHPGYVSWLPGLGEGSFALPGDHPDQPTGGLSGWGWMGLSYFVFRAVDACFAARRAGASIGPAQTALLGLYFVPYVSGPVNRIAPLAADLAAPDAPLDVRRVRDALLRASLGIIKILFLAKWAYFLSVASPEFAEARLPGPAGLALGAFAFYLYIYFDFSGYTDVAIALSGLFGVRLPENFDRPYLAGNLQEFWNRWHMSLSLWFRDYLFFPSLSALRKRLPGLPAQASQAAALFVTFLFMGAWHGDGFNWLVYGLFHGASMSLWSLKRWLEDSLAPDFFRTLRVNPLYVWLCRAFTFAYVSFGMLLMLDFAKLAALLAG